MSKQLPKPIKRLRGPSTSKLLPLTMLVYGQLYSMKNSRAPIHGTTRTMKHPKAQAFEKEFEAQTFKVKQEIKKDLPINGDLRLEVNVRYPSDRQDLDCELIPDLLEKHGFIINDRQIRQKIYHKGEASKDSPLVVVMLQQMEAHPFG